MTIKPEDIENYIGSNMEELEKSRQEMAQKQKAIEQSAQAQQQAQFENEVRQQAQHAVLGRLLGGWISEIQALSGEVAVLRSRAEKN